MPFQPSHAQKFRARPLAVKHRIEGNPDPKYVSTSYAGRSNLGVRMHTRSFTRLTSCALDRIAARGHPSLQII
jgi:hypothetical protein